MRVLGGGGRTPCTPPLNPPLVTLTSGVGLRGSDCVVVTFRSRVGLLGSDCVVVTIRTREGLRGIDCVVVTLTSGAGLRGSDCVVDLDLGWVSLAVIVW